MFDMYVVKNITDYLKLCKKCNTYHINNYNQICIICKKFYCNDCSKYELIRNYNEYETTSNYCDSCNFLYFNYLFK